MGSTRQARQASALNSHHLERTLCSGCSTVCSKSRRDSVTRDAGMSSRKRPRDDLAQQSALQHAFQRRGDEAPPSLDAQAACRICVTCLSKAAEEIRRGCGALLLRNAVPRTVIEEARALLSILQA